MSYFINPNNEYPRHIGDIQIEFPNWIEGDALPEGWSEVASGDVPVVDADHYWVEVAPAEVDGVLTRQFKVLPITDEMKRDQILNDVRAKVTRGESLTKSEVALLIG